MVRCDYVDFLVCRRIVIDVGEVTDVLKVFSSRLCYNTQAMPTFQAMNFLYVTLLTPRFLKWPEGFWKICGPQP